MRTELWVISCICARTHRHAHRSSLCRATLNQARAVLQTAHIVSDDSKSVPSISKLSSPRPCVIAKVRPRVCSLHKLVLVSCGKARTDILVYRWTVAYRFASCRVRFRPSSPCRKSYRKWMVLSQAICQLAMGRRALVRRLNACP